MKRLNSYLNILGPNWIFKRILSRKNEENMEEYIKTKRNVIKGHVGTSPNLSNFKIKILQSVIMPNL